MPFHLTYKPLCNWQQFIWICFSISLLQITTVTLIIIVMMATIDIADACYMSCIKRYKWTSLRCALNIGFDDTCRHYYHRYIKACYRNCFLTGRHVAFWRCSTWLCTDFRWLYLACPILVFYWLGTCISFLRQFTIRQRTTRLGSEHDPVR